MARAPAFCAKGRSEPWFARGCRECRSRLRKPALSRTELGRQCGAWSVLFGRWTWSWGLTVWSDRSRHRPRRYIAAGAERVGGLEGGLGFSCASRVARLPATISADAVRRGVVRQQGFGAYVSFKDAGLAVGELASLLVQELAKTATPGAPVLPPFNEVTWTHYPAGLGHISEHRDPAVYTGIIVVTTLHGEARFVACSDAGDQHECWRSTGDIVLLTGWDGPPRRLAVRFTRSIQPPPPIA